jgi:hypothetical protein
MGRRRRSGRMEERQQNKSSEREGKIAVREMIRKEEKG